MMLRIVMELVMVKEEGDGGIDGGGDGNGNGH